MQQQKMSTRTTNRSDLQKDTWYNFRRGNTSVDGQIMAKTCRCVLEAAENQLHPHGHYRRRVYNPYAVCVSSLSKAYNASPYSLTRGLVTGQCTKRANFQNMPTEILYAYAQSRPKRAARIFDNLPSSIEFYNPHNSPRAMERYKSILLQDINRYKSRF